MLMNAPITLAVFKAVRMVQHVKIHQDPIGKCRSKVKMYWLNNMIIISNITLVVFVQLDGKDLIVLYEMLIAYHHHLQKLVTMEFVYQQLTHLVTVAYVIKVGKQMAYQLHARWILMNVKI